MPVFPRHAVSLFDDRLSASVQYGSGCPFPCAWSLNAADLLPRTSGLFRAGATRPYFSHAISRLLTRCAVRPCGDSARSAAKCRYLGFFRDSASLDSRPKPHRARGGIRAGCLKHLGYAPPITKRLVCKLDSPLRPAKAFQPIKHLTDTFDSHDSLRSIQRCSHFSRQEHPECRTPRNASNTNRKKR